MKSFREYLEESALAADTPVAGDTFAINIREECLLETYVLESTGDDIVLYADDKLYETMKAYGYIGEKTIDIDGTPMNQYDFDTEEEIGEETHMGPDPSEYDQEGDMAKDDLETIIRAARRLTGMLDDNENMPEWVQSKINKAADYVDTAADYIESNEDEVEVDEAEYQGREVQLNKPMAGDIKKSKVYVKNPQGNVVKVNFGDPDMKIKKSNPARRRSFRARHHCENPGPKHKARYWSCRAW